VLRGFVSTGKESTSPGKIAAAKAAVAHIRTEICNCRGSHGRGVWPTAIFSYADYLLSSL
jgi:hypothetical protein